MKSQAKASDGISDRYHQKVAEYINQQAGIQLPRQKRTLIETRLRKRQRELGIETLHDYIDYALDARNDEQLLLIDALTTNKTEFFREANHYPLLLSHLPEVRGELKLWSAGCSSGEEPYTLAMLLQDHGVPHYSILATDISTSVLHIAQQAIYLHDDVEPVPLAMRKKYLLRAKDPTRDEIRISPKIRQHVRFGLFNLITGNFASMGPFHVIFCRNVMIYFNSAQRDQLIRRFVSRLKPGGLFFIGHSESLEAHRYGLHQIAPTVYRLNQGGAHD